MNLGQIDDHPPAARRLRRLLRTLLYDVSPFDPFVYSLGFLALVIAALAAMLAPALRASRVNPVIALRTD